MLNITGLNHFYYVRDFTDMRCKHLRALSIIRERLHREPIESDVNIMISSNRRIVRMFSFDNHSYSLFEKKFVASYQFLKVEGGVSSPIYRIDWKDVVLILESPIVIILEIKQIHYIFIRFIQDYIVSLWLVIKDIRMENMLHIVRQERELLERESML